MKIGQSSHKMYSNNIVNFQESMTILNTCTKKSGNLLNAPHIYTMTFVDLSLIIGDIFSFSSFYSFIPFLCLLKHPCFYYLRPSTLKKESLHRTYTLLQIKSCEAIHPLKFFFLLLFLKSSNLILKFVTLLLFLIWLGNLLQSQQISTQQEGWCPCGVMVKAIIYGIIVSKFGLQLRYYVHFRTNTLGKGTNVEIHFSQN